MKFQPGQTVWWLCPFPRQLHEVIINGHQPYSILKAWDVKLGGKLLYALESELFSDEEEAVKERDNTYFQPGQIVWWLSPFSRQVHPVTVIRWSRYSTFSLSGHWVVEGLSHGEKIRAFRRELFPCREAAYDKRRELYLRPERRYW
jgi:hypothetical protein